MKTGTGGVALATVLLALVLVPGDAMARGSWTSSDLTLLALRWETDAGNAVQQTRFRLTQPVSEAATAEGSACSAGREPTEISCPVGGPASPGQASSGVVEVTVRTPVGCSDQFEFDATDASGQTAAQQPLTSGNECAPPDGGGGASPPPGESNEEPAGAPVSRPRLPLVVGADGGMGPRILSYGLPRLDLVHGFDGYAPSFTGGVRVAVGDVNGDGVADIIAGAGPGAGPHVKVFDGQTGALVLSFLAFDPGFRGGVYVAVGDFDGDGREDVVAGSGAGGTPHVKVFSAATGALLRSFFAYESFSGGVRVAAGDVNGDGRADIVTGAGPGGGPHVKVFDGRSGAPIRSFHAFDASFTGGVFVAAGDVDGDGPADLVVGQGESAGAVPHIKIFSGNNAAERRSFTPFPGFAGGVRVATGDVNGDGIADVVAASGGGAPGGHVKVFDGQRGAQHRELTPFPSSFTGGVFVGATSFGGVAFLPRAATPTRRGTVAFTVTCSRAVNGSCRGKVELLGLPRLAGAGPAARRRARAIGVGRFRLAPGQRGRARVRLTRRYRRTAPRRRTRVTARVVSRDGGGNVRTRTYRVTLKPRPAQRRRR